MIGPVAMALVVFGGLAALMAASFLAVLYPEVLLPPLRAIAHRLLAAPRLALASVLAWLRHIDAELNVRAREPH